jgi:hypothetical protein
VRAHQLGADEEVALLRGTTRKRVQRKVIHLGHYAISPREVNGSSPPLHRWFDLAVH